MHADACRNLGLRMSIGKLNLDTFQSLGRPDAAGRGAQVRAEGMYISEKLDLLIQYLLVDPFQALFSRVFKREARGSELTLCIADTPAG